MGKRLNRMGIVLIKNFLSINEAAKLHGLTQKELLELAYPIGTVYEINGRKFRLINEKILRRFMDKNMYLHDRGIDRADYRDVTNERIARALISRWQVVGKITKMLLLLQNLQMFYAYLMRKH